MTLEEKASQVVHQAAAIPRLGVPAYNWWTEALHGVLTSHATVFPEPIGLAASFDGVHVGQEDLSPEGARAVLGDRLWVGVSTHSVEQVIEADQTSADYVAIGPVFATASKQNPDPVVGLEGVRAARVATRKPLVAIGGITRVNCASVIQAGADSVAVISDLVHGPAKSVAAFLRVLG